MIRGLRRRAEATQMLLLLLSVLFSGRGGYSPEIDSRGDDGSSAASPHNAIFDQGNTSDHELQCYWGVMSPLTTGKYTCRELQTQPRDQNTTLGSRSIGI